MNQNLLAVLIWVGFWLFVGGLFLPNLAPFLWGTIMLAVFAVALYEELRKRRRERGQS